MRATPQPISSIRYFLFSVGPETLRAFPSPALIVMSANFAPNAVRANSALPMARNARRDSLMPAAFSTVILQKLAPLLFQLIGLAIQLDESLHSLPALVRFAELPVDGSKHVEIGR